MAFLAVACSGGGGGVDQPAGPTIGAIAPQSVNQDTSIGPLAVSVSEAGGSPNQLVVTAHSSDAALVPDANISVVGDGSARTLSLAPVADGFGSAMITITAKDAQGRAAERSFQVLVNPVYASFTKVADGAFAASEDAAPVTLSGVTLQPDADDNADAFVTLLQ
jgi:hypothetical protein